MSLFLKGLAIGFAIAATVGPISVLCIRRTLADGRLAGLVAGLGAATADAIYGAIAAFGLTLVVEFLVEQQQWLALGGGLFLCWLGLEAWRAEPARLEDAPAVRLGGLAGGFGTTLLLTLANPVTILSFAAVFAGLGLAAAP
ncbi:MAG TPA: LysE family transporter, partial [Alphaproteobacteria bacterium]